MDLRSWCPVARSVTRSDVMPSRPRHGMTKQREVAALLEESHRKELLALTTAGNGSEDDVQYANQATGVGIPHRDVSKFLTIDGAAEYLVDHSTN